MPMILGYWDIRGLAHCVRLLLEYTGSDYEEKKYIYGGGNGTTEEEKMRVDILQNQATDTSNDLARVCYSPDFEKLKPQYLEALPGKMKLYSQFLGKRPWFAGDKITFVDFLAYDALDIHRVFEPKCLDAFPNLKDFMVRVEGLKKISAYMKSSHFLPHPVFGREALWGNN
ncbi:glutathione S-transferase Mu 1-like [Echinops telfairi]|uniref:Glutathione S-transferase Mu 1-like n=1 Tax=Echinops telfairi TaxID=9371 RepID=A0AC55D879_ECHTE|nr:glutathione S-transferase Mu 1-like [Echinops telfairi]